MRVPVRYVLRVCIQYVVDFFGIRLMLATAPRTAWLTIEFADGAMKQCSSSREHVNRCCTVSSLPHSQVTLVNDRDI